MTLEEVIERAFPCSKECNPDRPGHRGDCDAIYRKNCHRAVREALELAAIQVPDHWADLNIGGAMIRVRVRIRALAASLEEKP